MKPKGLKDILSHKSYVQSNILKVRSANRTPKIRRTYNPDQKIIEEELHSKSKSCDRNSKKSESSVDHVFQRDEFLSVQKSMKRSLLNSKRSYKGHAASVERTHYMATTNSGVELGQWSQNNLIEKQVCQTARKSIRSMASTKRNSPALKSKRHKRRNLRSPGTMSSRRGSDGIFKLNRKSYRENYMKKHQKLKKDNKKVVDLIGFRSRDHSGGKKRINAEIKKADERRKCSSIQPSKSDSKKSARNFISFRFHSPFSGKKGEKILLQSTKKLHSPNYKLSRKSLTKKVLETSSKEYLIKLILEAKKGNHDNQLANFAELILEENEYLKKKLEENYKATNTLIESLTEIKLTNKSRCINSQETCQKLNEKVGDLENKIVEIQFDKKSIMEEREILTSNNEELLRKIEDLEKFQDEQKIIGPELEEIEEKITEITDQHEEERNFLYIEIVRDTIIL